VELPPDTREEPLKGFLMSALCSLAERTLCIARSGEADDLPGIDSRRVGGPETVEAESARTLFNPQYPEFEPGTMWSLSNTFTSAFKKMDPIPRFKATGKLGEDCSVLLGDIPQHKGEYREAAQQMKIFLAIVPQNPFADAIAKQ